MLYKNEGERLKAELRGEFNNMNEAADKLQVSRAMLYEYFKMKKLSHELYEYIIEKTGIDLRKENISEDQNNELQQLKKRLEIAEREKSEILKEKSDLQQKIIFLLEEKAKNNSKK